MSDNLTVVISPPPAIQAVISQHAHLVSVIGVQGPQGPQGESVTGPQGVQGPQGPQGPQGESVTGPQGVQGEPGDVSAIRPFAVAMAVALG